MRADEIANVATPSISQSLGLSAQQYGAVVSVVYATYVVFEPAWANLLKILSPKYVCMSSSSASHRPWTSAKMMKAHKLIHSERLHRRLGHPYLVHGLGQGLQPHDRHSMLAGLL
jgi:hypothetical protein